MKSKTPRKPKESILKQKSPAEFFTENKSIAGFDNPGKCLYTTVTELVENSLASAESISEVPYVEITIDEIGKSKFNSLLVVAGTIFVSSSSLISLQFVSCLAKKISKGSSCSGNIGK